MTVPLAILGTFLAAAAAADVAQRRVPNAVVGPLAVAGLAALGVAGGGWAVARGLLAGAIVLLVLFYPWARGKLGAGDVKLAAAAAIWLGPERLVPFLLLAGAAGLPVAIAARIGHRLAQRRLVARLTATGLGVEGVAARPESVPLAVAIAIGALAVARGGMP